MYVGQSDGRKTEFEFLALRPFRLSKLSNINLIDAADEDDEEKSWDATIILCLFFETIKKVHNKSPESIPTMTESK